jgi:CRP/FNR family transcriptional regulator, anaerobic regulatory protein
MIKNELMKKFDLSDSDIEDFWLNAQCVKFSKKQLLLEENQINRYLYMVKEGVIRSYGTDKAGNTYSKSFFYGPNQDFVASFSSFKFQEPSKFFLEAITDTEVWAWHYTYIFDKLVNDFRFHRFFRYCTDKLYFRLEEKEIIMLRTTPEERYLLFKNEHPKLIDTIPLHYIASYLGITPETLSRIRKRVGSSS